MCLETENLDFCDECGCNVELEQSNKEKCTDELIRIIGDKITDSSAFIVPFALHTFLRIQHIECYAGGGIDLKLEVNAEFGSVSELCLACDNPLFQSMLKSDERIAREEEEIKTSVQSILESN